MPNLDSAKKNMRKAAKRTVINSARKGAVRTVTRHMAKAVMHHDLAGAEEALKPLQVTVDKVAAKGPIHRNKASRLKSRAMRKVNAMRAAAAKQSA